jgi:hypothetical protein
VTFARGTFNPEARMEFSQVDQPVTVEMPKSVVLVDGERLAGMSRRCIESSGASLDGSPSVTDPAAVVEVPC